MQLFVCAAWRVITGMCMCSMTCCYRYLNVQHDVLFQVSVCTAWRVVPGICMCSMTCCYRYVYVQHDMLLQVSVCTTWRVVPGTWIFSTVYVVWTRYQRVDVCYRVLSRLASYRRLRLHDEGLMTCTPHLMLFGWSNLEEWDRYGM